MVESSNGSFGILAMLNSFHVISFTGLDGFQTCFLSPETISSEIKNQSMIMDNNNFYHK